jgi:ubiquinone/menaquinone biosynthesis C-methylase UbiE
MLAERRMMRRLRGEVFGELPGRVLDLGAGVGYSFDSFQKADRVVALEPDPAMLGRARARAESRPIELVLGDGMRLPFRDGSFDAVAAALVLCTVPDLAVVLAEVRRVLRPGGMLAFLEHVRLPGWKGRLQDVAAPTWRRLAVGCRLNRRTGEAIRAAGFAIERVDSHGGGVLLVGLATVGAFEPGPGRATMTRG